MIRLVQIGMLVLLVLSCTPRAPRSCSTADPTRTREELAQKYATFRTALMNNAPQAWIDALDSSFTLTTFDGVVRSKSWIENYMHATAKQFTIRALQFNLQAIQVRADTAVATVQQISDRNFTDEHGAPHRLELEARQLETWVCTLAGWRIRHVKEDSLVSIRRDGR